ncbi:ribonuclease H2, subunit B [Scleroderma citrinum]
MLEVQAVAPPNARSWFVGDDVISDGRLLVMTPIDPLFLLIPLLTAGKQREGEQVFRPADDIFEQAATQLAEGTQAPASQDPSLAITTEDIMRFGALECTRNAMKRVCEVKEITAEIIVFRYSQKKLIDQLEEKVRALARPQIAEMSRCLIRGLAKDALMEDKHEDLLDLGRTRLACDLLGQYLPSEILAEVMASYDFTKFDAHVRSLKHQQLDPLPVAGVAPRKGRKAANTAVSDENNKKRKKETTAFQGGAKSKKANVQGMAKLSTFFAKKTA